MYLKKTKPLLDELSSLIKNTNAIDLWKGFEPSIDACEAELSNISKVIFVDIILYGRPSKEERDFLENYFDQPLDPSSFESYEGLNISGKSCNNIQLNLRFLNWRFVQSHFFERNKHISFCFLFSESTSFFHIEQHVKLMVENSVWANIFSNTPWKTKEKDAIKNAVGSSHFQIIETSEGQQMNDTLGQILNTRNLEICQAYSCMESIHSVYKALSISSEEYKQSIAVKKIQLIQKMAHCQKKIKHNQNYRNDIKNIMSIRHSQFEDRFKSVIEQNFSAPLGYLIQFAEQQSALIEELVETKKSKQITYTIDPEFEKSFLNDFRYNSSKIYLKEKKEGLKCVKTIEREFGEILKKQGLELNTKQVDDTNESSINQLLQHKIFFDKKYEATVNNRGIMEYIMGARMYYMYIMMGASMLGFNIRFIPGGKQLLIPIAILLIGLGIYQVWSSKQNEKDDDLEKNLQKAQDYITSEAKKICQDISRLFEKLIADEVRKKSQQLLLETERLIQEKQQNEQRKNDIEKTKIDRLLKNISNQERSLEMLSRNESTFKRNLDRLKQDLQTALKPQRAESPVGLQRREPKRLNNN